MPRCCRAPVDQCHQVIANLGWIALQRGFTTAVYFDNGPEFIAASVADSRQTNGNRSVFLDPGRLRSYAWIEPFNSCQRNEFRNGWQFDNLTEAQVHIED